MPYRLKIAESAKKDLSRLPSQERQRIGERIRALGEDPRPSGCAKLRGTSHSYRIRIGRYRVLYSVDDAEQCVVILRVKHRKEAYRGL